ncbi:MAG: protein kinase [candidate division Zixibacteria bacterium]|nr:protein kinase [candidate division Zixibacteria bacterium]
MIGEVIAHYKIIEKLGSGGMGEVFLATDTKLDRKVALKFLPEHLALEGEVKARFLQEAKAAAAFTHPNVCSVYDVQEHDDRMFIVMEYVDGQTLRDKKDTLSITQTVEIIAQIADGLAAAHQQGIVHRDIKSENIMLRKDGIAQLTDFGLAKLKGVTSRLTKEGSTLGTTGYMSPEQALGQDVDHRSDIFSLGVVLYELLTGEMPFTGSHEAAIMYEIVNVDAAPPTALNPDLDPELDRIILECLQKEPDERYQSAREVAKDLRRFKRDSGRKRVSRVSQSRVSPSRAPVQRTSTAPHSVVDYPEQEQRDQSQLPWLPWGLAAVLAIACAMLVYLLTGYSSDGARQTVRFNVQPPTGSTITLMMGGNIAISPNGRMIACTAVDSTNDMRLWIRSIDAFEARPLTGTDGATYPFWSPDSRFVGFYSDGKLKKIDVTGGPPLSLCDAMAGRGGSWNEDGVIIFPPDQEGWLYKVPAAGGPPEQITFPDTARSEATHRWPAFLPDGNRFLYYSRSSGSSTEDALVLSSLDRSVHKILMYHNGNASYANEHIIFVRENVVMAHPFDLSTDTLAGTPFPIAEQAHFNGRFNNHEFSVSNNGALVYLSGGTRAGLSILRINRQGHILDSIGGRDHYINLRMSPTGNRLAVAIADEESSNADIWIVDLVRDVTSRLTFDSTGEFQAVWSPAGDRVAYVSASAGSYKIYTKAVSGTGEPQLVLDTTIMVRPADWSSDGRNLLCRIRRESSTEDKAIIVPINPDGTPTEDSPYDLVDSPGDVDVGTFSPDGRWFAYASSETGRMEVYVRPFPGRGGKWQISSNGGDLPIWSEDGSEIFFLDNSYERIMTAKVDGSGTSLEVGQVTSLFRHSFFSSMSPYDVDQDGQEFVVISDLKSIDQGHMRVVLNWNAGISTQ